MGRSTETITRRSAFRAFSQVGFQMHGCQFEQAAIVGESIGRDWISRQVASKIHFDSQRIAHRLLVFTTHQFPLQWSLQRLKCQHSMTASIDLTKDSRSSSEGCFSSEGRHLFLAKSLQHAVPILAVSESNLKSASCREFFAVKPRESAFDSFAMTRKAMPAKIHPAAADAC